MFFIKNQTEAGKEVAQKVQIHPKFLGNSADF